MRGDQLQQVLMMLPQNPWDIGKTDIAASFPVKVNHPMSSKIPQPEHLHFLALHRREQLIIFAQRNQLWPPGYVPMREQAAIAHTHCLMYAFEQ
ncbi:hypothetical protein FQZ97_988340 [compost metagenome]